MSAETHLLERVAEVQQLRSCEPIHPLLEVGWLRTHEQSVRDTLGNEEAAGYTRSYKTNDGLHVHAKTDGYRTSTPSPAMNFMIDWLCA